VVLRQLIEIGFSSSLSGENAYKRKQPRVSASSGGGDLKERRALPARAVRLVTAVNGHTRFSSSGMQAEPGWHSSNRLLWEGVRSTADEFIAQRRHGTLIMHLDSPIWACPPLAIMLGRRSSDNRIYLARSKPAPRRGHLQFRCTVSRTCAAKGGGNRRRLNW
jgi:hypothetical protein